MKTIEEVANAIERYFGDTSLTQAETRAGLESFARQIQAYLDVLPEDDK